jgi:hypothetical protein
MSEHTENHEHSHEEDHSVCFKVGVFFIAALAAIILVSFLK